MKYVFTRCLVRTRCKDDGEVFGFVFADRDVARFTVVMSPVRKADAWIT